ncbi:MAG TPA: shikimate dehydrogenase [Gemmatimonadales bacterium]|nr:shikimate dehydrogenase [Gemmatimonadales bacterium]
MIGGKTRVFAILGDPVAHSLSPAMHNAAFRALGLDAVYVALRVSANDLPGLLTAVARAGGGGNVTVPHKEAASGAVTHPSRRVAALGACNTYWGSGEQVHGDNTDVDGVLAALDQLEAPATAWLIAGTGGGARAAVAAAVSRNAAVAVRSRDAGRRLEFEAWARGLGARVVPPSECEVLINSTPLGLKPGDHLPLALEAAPQAQAAFDMVYGRGETAWVREMRQEGLRTADGRVMLVAQGAAAFRRWFPDEDPPVEIMRAAVNEALR